MDPITIYVGSGSVQVILIIVQMIKGFVSDSRWYMPMSVLLGILINAGIAIVTGPATAVDILNAILIGILAGGAASGVYSGTHTTDNPAVAPVPVVPPTNP